MSQFSGQDQWGNWSSKKAAEDFWNNWNKRAASMKKQREFEVIRDFTIQSGRKYKAGERGIYASDGFFDWEKNQLYVWQDPNIQYALAPIPPKASDYLKVVVPGTEVQNVLQRLSSSEGGMPTSVHYVVYAALWAGLLYFGNKLWKSKTLGEYTPLAVTAAVLLLGINTVFAFKPLIMPKPQS